VLKQFRADRVFTALADPTRRQLLERLSSGPASVSELAARVPVSLAAVVQHIQMLEDCGVITTKKAGRVRTCQLLPDGLAPAASWIEERRLQWEKRLDRLGAFLDEQDKKQDLHAPAKTPPHPKRKSS